MNLFQHLELLHGSNHMTECMFQSSSSCASNGVWGERMRLAYLLWRRQVQQNHVCSPRVMSRTFPNLICELKLKALKYHMAGLTEIRFCLKIPIELMNVTTKQNRSIQKMESRKQSREESHSIWLDILLETSNMLNAIQKA
ncbi:hypothetical protein DITRI_Ditri04bG0061000 [Diplodiscus trichospermus]